MQAARHASSRLTSPTATTSVGSPLRQARWTSWSTTPACIPFAATVDTDDADFDAHFDTNLRAPYILVQKLVPGMIERGHGTVVNISTVAATTPSAEAGIYGASKAALDLLTKLWADEFGGAGIRVNAIAPGPIETEGTADIPEIVEGLGRTRALERVGEPDEIARAVAFIASPAASYINGVVLPVDGGAQALRPAA